MKPNEVNPTSARPTLDQMVVKVLKDHPGMTPEQARAKALVMLKGMLKRGRR